jgi:hypothetical protein
MHAIAKVSMVNSSPALQDDEPGMGSFGFMIDSVNGVHL